VPRRAEEDDLAHRLQRLVVRLYRELRGDSFYGPVSSVEGMVLFDLRRHPGSGVSDLATMARVNRSVMSERVKRLEAAGLVMRDPATGADRRRVSLMVTADGHALLERMARARRDRMAARLERLEPAERAAIEAAVDALDKLPDWRSAAEIAADEQRKTNGRMGHGQARIRSA
jgi:DNA-binding MarR family transcriptional regulator